MRLVCHIGTDHPPTDLTHFQEKSVSATLRQDLICKIPFLCFRVSTNLPALGQLTYTAIYILQYSIVHHVHVQGIGL